MKKSIKKIGTGSVSLGPLEQKIMNCLWQKKTCTPRDVLKDLSQDKKIAYNTVQTVMTRLVDKGLLERNLQGKTHFYTSKVKKESILKSIISNTMSSFVSQFGDEALLAFVDGIDDLSDETRKKLISKLQKK